MHSRIAHILLLCFVGFAVNSCAQKDKKQLITKGSQNTIEAQSKPYLILISLDGFRWDYVDRIQPPHLSKFIAEGVHAEALIPSYPTKTFPNHYTIATGMYPDHHGLLGNSYYSYDQDALYNMRDRDLVEDGRFYKGTPIWNAAMNAGMLAASYFFVGSEANIQGQFPTYHYKFDGSVPNDRRMAQIIDWLELPEARRPHLITGYFSTMDDAGHRFGPDADAQLKERLIELDALFGKFFAQIEALELSINIIFVSDHGMKGMTADQLLPIEQVENESLYQTISNGSTVSIHPIDASLRDTTFGYLKSIEKNWKVYPTSDVPIFEIPLTNPDWGAFQIIPDSTYYFSDVRRIKMRQNSKNTAFGHHGFGPSDSDMHGIFYAHGPAFESGLVIPPIKNIHIYPLMCAILGIDPPEDIDGRLEVIQDVLRP